MFPLILPEFLFNFSNMFTKFHQYVPKFLQNHFKIRSFTKFLQYYALMTQLGSHTTLLVPLRSCSTIQVSDEKRKSLFSGGMTDVGRIEGALNENMLNCERSTTMLIGWFRLLNTQMCMWPSRKRRADTPKFWGMNVTRVQPHTLFPQ